MCYTDQAIEKKKNTKYGSKLGLKQESIDKLLYMIYVLIRRRVILVLVS